MYRGCLLLGQADLFLLLGPEASVANMLCQIMCQAKQHPSLIPFFVFIGAGDTRAALYMMNLALKIQMSVGTGRITQDSRTNGSP